MARRASLLASIVLVSAWAAGTAFAQTTEVPRAAARDHVVVVGDLIVPRERAAGEVVVFRGTATVLGVVRGDVVVLEGSAAIAGRVDGDVVVVDGPVRLRGSAVVGGSVLAGGEVERDVGARVEGTVREHLRFTLGRPLRALGSLLAPVAMTASLLLVLLVLLGLAPWGLERAADALRTAPLPSIAWGFLIAVVWPAAALALAASVLALPLGIALLFGIGLASAVGLAVEAFSLGRLVVPAPRGRGWALLVGWAITGALGLVPGLNVLAWVVLATIGLGACVVASHRAGRHRRSAEPDRAHEPGSVS